MIALIRLLLGILASPFKSKSRLEAENAALRQQLIVLRRKAKGRAPLTNADRWFFVLLYRWFPSILEVLTIIRPETLVRWHRVGPRRYWRWKSREQRGWPQIQAELRALIRRMSSRALSRCRKTGRRISFTRILTLQQRPRATYPQPRFERPGVFLPK
jgi:hypothetical protein